MQATETVLSVIRNVSPGNDHWRARYGETVRRLTRRWIAPTGGRGSGGDDLWDTHPT